MRRRGGSFLHPEHVRLLLEEPASSPAAEGTADDFYALLSPREQQMLRLIALGHANQQVASMLGLTGRAALVHCALQRGLLEDQE